MENKPKDAHYLNENENLINMLNGKNCRVLNFMQGGVNAKIKYDDGAIDTVKWRMLVPESMVDHMGPTLRIAKSEYNGFYVTPEKDDSIPKFCVWGLTADEAYYKAVECQNVYAAYKAGQLDGFSAAEGISSD